MSYPTDERLFSRCLECDGDKPSSLGYFCEPCKIRWRFDAVKCLFDGMVACRGSTCRPQAKFCLVTDGSGKEDR